jgi:hypothetical protein
LPPSQYPRNFEAFRRFVQHELSFNRFQAVANRSFLATPLATRAALVTRDFGHGDLCSSRKPVGLDKAVGRTPVAN